MKKLMFAAAVMAVGAAMAVESQTVGYTSRLVPQDSFAMVGVQFEGIGNGEGEIAINDLITGNFSPTDYDSDDAYFDTATEVQVWDGGTYVFYYYLKAHEIEGVAHPQGWCDDWGEYTSDTLPAGACVWFHNRSSFDCTVTTPGQIVTAEDTEIPCENEFTMAANFMPVELDLNNSNQVEYTGLVGTDWDENDEYFDTATEIQLWDGGTYVFYYYLNAHQIEDVSFDEGWCDDWGETASDSIPVGCGFWIHARTGSFTVTFKK